MPTKKPVVQVVLEETYHKKLLKLAEPHKRSASNQGARIIEEYINQYEKDHGPIQIENE